MSPRVDTAVVTGANRFVIWDFGGVGLALCDRLLTNYPQVKLCMVCRNKARGESAKESLLSTHTDADIHLVLADVGSLKSVKRACQQITEILETIKKEFSSGF